MHTKHIPMQRALPHIPQLQAADFPRRTAHRKRPVRMNVHIDRIPHETPGASGPRTISSSRATLFTPATGVIPTSAIHSHLS
ncbi:TPA: hypothetical protein ACLA7F_000146 [Neisseria meningitidis]